MRAAILAGGLGCRLSEETRYRPKALIEIGQTPILWHLISIFGRQGFSSFSIALGYRANQIRAYFGATESSADVKTVVCDFGWKVHLGAVEK